MSRFSLYYPNFLVDERDYIASVIFNEFLGIDCRSFPGQNPIWRLTDQEGKCSIFMPDVFFASAQKNWLNSKPDLLGPVSHWNTDKDLPEGVLTDKKIPVIFGKTNRDSWLVKRNKKEIHLGLDILGSAFFMLTRYEEIAKPDRDEHLRFPGWASAAFLGGFLDRPIVDEYVEVLWAIMKSLWPGLRRKITEPKTLISCDVDFPYQAHVKSWRGTLKKVSRDIIVKKSFFQAGLTVANSFATKCLNNYKYDTNNTFSWIMDVNEKAGNQVAFYFFSDAQKDAHNSIYSLNEPRIIKLLKMIHIRNHEIGLHGSYNSYRDQKQAVAEVERLRQIMLRECLSREWLGGRQHVLRWDSKETPAIWDNAGLDYDTTLTFADYAGFRCGTCKEYPMFDLQGRKTLNLMQRPLIVMESSVLAERHMGLGYSERAIEVILDLKEKCRRMKGNFTLLWHNSHFKNSRDKDLYLELIK